MALQQITGLIVIANKEFGDKVMILEFTGERKTFADIAGNTGSQGSIPSFDVISFTALLAHLLVIALAEQDAVRLPVIAERLASEVLYRDLASSLRKVASLRSPITYSLWGDKI